jgi:uncharacterized protein (TIGR03435 family)
MTLRLLGLLITIALTAVFGQFDFPGVFGKITSHPTAGDLAPEISFAKVLHNAASAPWSSANLNGQVTVLMFLPYVSGNPHVVSEWNALVEKFAGKPVQFMWITDEDESALLPFLQDHPIQGWVFHDPDGATGRSYGLESPQPVIIGADRRIVGFDGGIVPREEVVNAVLEDRITTTPPQPTRESFRAFSESKPVLLSPEPQRMPRPDEHRPDFPPSYAVHVAPAKDELGGGNYSGMDFLSLQGYTVKRLFSEMLDVSPLRIDLPVSIDASARYDFSIVLPKDEDQETRRSVMRQGVEDYFHLAASRQNQLRDVYVLTASDQRLPVSARDPDAGGLFRSSSVGFLEIGGLDDLIADKPHDIDAITSVSMDGSTVDEFCDMLERTLDRPLINETKLDGRFDFRVPDPEFAPQELPKRDFVERLRNQLGLVIAPAQRSIETVVYRLR